MIVMSRFPTFSSSSARESEMQWVCREKPHMAMFMMAGGKSAITTRRAGIGYTRGNRGVLLARGVRDLTSKWRRSCARVA